MKYIFFGTPQFAAIILEKLIKAGFIPDMVVCNPDKLVGRKKILTSPPTKLVALKNNIPVWQPEKLDNSIGRPADFFIVAAYAKILPMKILEVPRLGSIGVHPSLLPKYRGPSPIQTAILNGDKETGVTIYLLDEKMDHGPILANSKFQIIGSKVNYESLMQKLAESGADLLIKILPKFTAGKIDPSPQNESQATYTKKFRTEDGFVEPVDLEKAQEIGGEAAIKIERMIRALNPEPGVWTYVKAGARIARRANGHMSININKDKRVKILEAEIIDGKLKINKIQLEGKNPQIIFKK